MDTLNGDTINIICDFSMLDTIRNLFATSKLFQPYTYIIRHHERKFLKIISEKHPEINILLPLSVEEKMTLENIHCHSTILPNLMNESNRVIHKMPSVYRDTGYRNDKKLIDLLVQYHTAYKNQIMYGAAEAGNLDLVKYLRTLDIEWNYSDYNIAKINGHDDVCTYLADNGCSTISPFSIWSIFFMGGGLRYSN